MTLDLPPLVLERQRIASSDAVRERLPYVDGLRAFAFFGVVAYYIVALLPATFAAQGTLARTALGLGSHGIELFFVLSGFCLAYPVLTVLRGDRQVGFDTARFAVKRFVRIVPPYYTAIALIVFLPVLALKLGHSGAGSAQAVGAVDIVKQMLFLDGGTKFVNPAFWTLCLQMRWYLLFPFALAIWIKSPRAFGIAVLGIAVAAPFTAAQSVDLAYLPAFLLGIVAADLRVQPLRFAGLLVILVPLLAVTAYALDASSTSLTYHIAIAPHFDLQTNVLWQLAAFAAVAAASEVRAVERTLSWRPFGFVAAVSYAAFLVFEPVFSALLHLLHARLTDSIAIVPASLGALAASIAFWRLVSNHFEGTAFKHELVDALTPGVSRVFGFAGIPSPLVFTDSALTEFPDPAAIAARDAALEFARDEEARRDHERSERRSVEQRQRQEAVDARRLKAEERIRRVHEAADRRAAEQAARREREEAARRAAEERAAEERARKEREEAERVAAEQRAVEQRAAEQRVAEERARKEREEAERVAAEQRAAELRAADERARKEREEAVAAEQRAAEQHAAEERARKDREEVERLAVEQRAAEQRAAAQRASEQRAAEERATEERAKAERAREERTEAKRIAAEEAKQRELAELDRQAMARQTVEVEAARQRVEADWRAAQERAVALRTEAEAQKTAGDRSSGAPAWTQRLMERLGRRPVQQEPEGPQFSVAERISRDFGTIEGNTQLPPPPERGEGDALTP